MVQRAEVNDTPERKKKLLRQCVAEIELAPEQLKVEITYSLPEPVMNGVVAGAGSAPEKKTWPCRPAARPAYPEPPADTAGLRNGDTNNGSGCLLPLAQRILAACTQRLPPAL